MNSIILIVSTVLGTVIGILSTLFVTNITQRKILMELTKDSMKTHVKIYHKYDIFNLIDKHEKECYATIKLQKIEKSLIFLVGQLGGDLKELGLLE